MNIDKNLKSTNKIIGVVLFENVRVKNTHNDFVFPEQDILEIDTENGFRIIDLFSQKDITDVDYFEIINTKKTKKKVLFKERDD